MGKKKIVIICGCGVATATSTEYQLKKILQENGLEADILKIRAGDTATSARGADLIIALTSLPVEVDAPVIQGVPFLTNIGIEQAALKVIEVLSK